MQPNQKFTDEQLIELYEQGLTQADIRRRLDVTKSTVRERLIRLGLLKTSAKSLTRLYKVWKNMKSRCYTKCSTNYKDYGGRGITVCDAWKSSSDTFIAWAKDNGYTENSEIDRIDNNGNYNELNCQFVTRRDNVLNQRLIQSDNTSGYNGVYYAKDRNKYRAQITINNKQIQLGSYKTKKEAVEVRNTYILENSLEHEYKIQEYIEES